MGALRPIVHSLVGTMLNAGHDLPLCCTTGSQFVGDHHTRRAALGFQQLAHQTFCRLGIAAALRQHVENKAILINGAPKPVFRPPMVMSPPMNDPCTNAHLNHIMGHDPLSSVVWRTDLR